MKHEHQIRLDGKTLTFRSSVILLVNRPWKPRVAKQLGISTAAIKAAIVRLGAPDDADGFRAWWKLWLRFREHSKRRTREIGKLKALIYYYQNRAAVIERRRNARALKRRGRREFVPTADTKA